ncbi:hypothetical protein DE146DRAFT_732260 [Phaeosphaeria sp. MPI-PUGE-AT-0046c]|nr:hypothetical protein DE146DRAFT_732260 [Phaeosphaeria sp. MPI-PUGE-AT-0046c]
MAGPLSVTASVVAVVTAGVIIAKGLYQIADNMGSAGQEVRIYASDIQLMASVLEGIGDQLQKKTRQSWSKAEGVIEDILNVCKNILGAMDQIQATLVPLLVRYKDSNKKLRQVRAWVWWFFKYKDKMLSYRQNLHNLNVTLNTHLAAMKLNTADNVTINISVQQSTLQLCVEKAKKLLHGRTRPQLMSKVSSQGRGITGDSIRTRRSSLRANGVAQNGAESTSRPDIIDFDDDEQQKSRLRCMGDMSQALILYSLQENKVDEVADGLDVDEVANVESSILGTLDGTPDNFSQDMWEDLGSIIRKFVRYAEEVHQASKGSPPQTLPLFSATKIHPPTICSENVEFVSGEVPVAGSTCNISRNSITRNTNDQFLKLKNIDGKTYLFPYEKVRSWRAKAVFDNDLFNLVGPQGLLILPRFWSKTIQPGWTVELQFEDIIEWPGKENTSSNNLEKAMVRQSQETADLEYGDRYSSIFGKFLKREEDRSPMRTTYPSAKESFD